MSNKSLTTEDYAKIDAIIADWESKQKDSSLVGLTLGKPKAGEQDITEFITLEIVEK